MKKILLVKESRAGEQRVALIPADVSQLVEHHYEVFVEHDAGKAAGFTDQEYQNAGAKIRYLKTHDDESYIKLFENIDMIVRAKRPDRSREIIENKIIAAGTEMIGALDPLDSHAPHIEEYTQRGIKAYSIDQLQLDADDPMNILAAMSRIAGKLAFLDAQEKFHGTPSQTVIIGFGTVGIAALKTALENNQKVTVVLNRSKRVHEVEQYGAQAVILDMKQSLSHQQNQLKKYLLNADIIITSARHANEKAPILIPIETLDVLKNGTVIVDMALSEGGNVEGSEHDKTHIYGNNVIVTNVSGYPKIMPNEASKLWSKASLNFILQLPNNNKL